MIFLSLAFDHCALGFLVWTTVTTPLREQLALALAAKAGAVIGSYVFGAIWDDKIKKG